MWLRWLILMLPMSCLMPATAWSQFHPDALVRASAYARATGGTAMLVMQHGDVLFENYHNGADERTATHIHSATKAFWAFAAARALQDGLLSSFDEPVSNTITEWQDARLHPGKRGITIRHLLSLSSGLSQDVEQIQGNNPAAHDIYRYVVDSLRITAVPGTMFSYGPSHYYAFGVLLQRKLRMLGANADPLAYLDSLLFEPIGLRYENWLRDSTGNPHVPNGCHLTPRNWATFGLLLLRNGAWNGVPLVDSSIMKTMYTPDGPNPGHGKFLWLNTKDGYGVTRVMSAPSGSPGGFMYHAGRNDIIGALGAGKNRMYVVPSLDAVIIRQTLAEDDAFDDNAFLSLLFSSPTGTEAVAVPRDDILVYPSVASNRITLVRSPAEQKFRPETIRIYDGMGRCVRTVHAAGAGDQVHIDVADLPAGVYFLHASTAKTVVTTRFIIAR